MNACHYQDSTPALKKVQCFVLIRFLSHSIYSKSQWKAASAFLHVSAFRKVFSQLNLFYQSETHTHIYIGNSYGRALEFFLTGSFAFKWCSCFESQCTMNKFFFRMFSICIYSSRICLQQK